MVDISEEYFQWLCHLIRTDKQNRSNYSSVLHRLCEREFWSDIQNDCNRIYDGLALREIFLNENCRYDVSYAHYFMDGCSILEIMVALAMRCENDIMHDPDLGNRMDIWFWEMFRNLGLDRYPDSVDEPDEVDAILDNLLERRYDRWGHGSMFPNENTEHNLRETELWYQMNFYAVTNWTI